MLRRDVDEAVVAAAARTPFEAAFRVFVLERADTMNDEAANALLKTLEEPAGYVVLLLLTDRPTQVLPTIASRCQPVRFDAPPPEELAARLERAGRRARAGAGRGAALARRRRAGARARPGRRAGAARPRRGVRARPAAPAATGAERPWLALLEAAAARGAAARTAHEERLAEELQFLPKKEHKRRETEVGEQARRADRRAQTAALDHGLQLAGPLVPRPGLRRRRRARAGPPRRSRRRAGRGRRGARASRRCATAAELVDDARARLALNVSYDLACEALAFRLERLFVTLTLDRTAVRAGSPEEQDPPRKDRP